MNQRVLHHDAASANDATQARARRRAAPSA